MPEAVIAWIIRRERWIFNIVNRLTIEKRKKYMYVYILGRTGAYTCNYNIILLYNNYISVVYISRGSRCVYSTIYIYIILERNNMNNNDKASHDTRELIACTTKYLIYTFLHTKQNNEYTLCTYVRTGQITRFRNNASPKKIKQFFSTRQAGWPAQAVFVFLFSFLLWFFFLMKKDAENQTHECSTDWSNENWWGKQTVRKLEYSSIALFKIQNIARRKCLLVFSCPHQVIGNREERFLINQSSMLTTLS